MHTSERVDVYLSFAAKPVIEKCTGIRFSEYPAGSLTSADGAKNEFRVEDFSHIRQTPSPNWTLRNDKTTTLDRWLKILRNRSGGTNELDSQMLDQILVCVGREGSERTPEGHHIGDTPSNWFTQI